MFPISTKRSTIMHPLITFILYILIGLSSAAVDPKIVNGEIAPINKYNWFSVVASENYLCGGSLISSEWILTAAHCVIENTSSPSAFDIGKYCVDEDNCGQPMGRIRVSKRVVHPNFDDYYLDNDFALIKLSSPSNITPVQIDDGSVSPSYPNFQPNLWAIGMGTTYFGGGVGSLPSALQHVELKYISNASCKNEYGYDPVDITSNMMCAADFENGNAQDSCSGDSGGPLYDSENNVLVGVVSWGYKCAEANYPGVYSRISAQIDWIKETVCNDHSQDTLPDWCTNDQVSSSPTTESCEKSSLTIITDEYPQEISWTISDSEGNIITSVDAGHYDEAGATYKRDFCLEPCTTYQFKISDTWGDGICSINYDGNYFWDVTGIGNGLSPGSPCGWNNQIFEFTTQCIQESNIAVDCKDSELDIVVNKKIGVKSCQWAQENASERCSSKAIKRACPVTCNTPEFCEHDAKKFILKEINKVRSCKWVAFQKKKRCRKHDMCNTCRSSCESTPSCKK